ncbi:zf-HC2 domain-containing protein [Nocardia thailandica]
MTDLADDYSTWDASYVLGSLSAAQRREYEEHLAECPHCREAVAELAGLPGLLALVDRDTALAMIEPPGEDAPPPDLVPNLAAAAERRRRRGRWVTVGSALAAAAAAVAVAIPVTMAVTRSDDPPAVAEQVVAQRQLQPLEQTPISAEVTILRDGDRTRLVMTCAYAETAYGGTWKYGLVVNTGGKRVELDQWSAGPGTEVRLERTVDADPDAISSVEITSGSGRTVLVGTF